MRFFKIFKTSIFLIGFLLCFCINAWAVPKLQLYIDGATYDTDTETWVYPGLEYDLWAIGTMDIDETIEEVRLAAAVKDDQSGSIEIRPIFSDDTLGDPLSSSFFSYDTPVKGDGKKLPEHGIYPSDFFEFQLENFNALEHGIPDFTNGYDPDNPEPTNAWGEIKEFHVIVTGYDWVHFDLFDHIEGDNHALFAPFSHDADAEDGGNPIPEPATMLLLGSGLVGIAGFRRKVKK